MKNNISVGITSISVVQIITLVHYKECDCSEKSVSVAKSVQVYQLQMFWPLAEQPSCEALK